MTTNDPSSSLPRARAALVHPITTPRRRRGSVMGRVDSSSNWTALYVALLSL